MQLVEFKQQTRLEEKRKQALDQHLSFIVDQTEKYSQLLAKDMNKSSTDVPQSQSMNSSRVPSPTHSDDDEFRPDDNSSDDEETIAQAEAADKKEEQSEEVAALQRESEMNLEEFLSELPKDYLEMRDKIKLSDEEEEEDDDESMKSEGKKKDDEFTVDSEEDSEDDEDTIMEQEQKEGKIDHKKEIDELEAENEMSIEELMKKYSAPLPDDDKMSVDEDVEPESEQESTEEEEEESETESSEEEKMEGDDVGLKSLLEDNSGEKNKASCIIF